jgi:branched-chain amino acid transport system substrate-binding protein
MRRRIPRLACLVAAGAVAAGLAGCGTGYGSGASGSRPIVIGISLPLTGMFSADGQAYDRGYHLWASVVNDHGGILGRPVKLIILNDKSSTTLVAKQYTHLITKDHVSLTFGPFSSLLTTPAGQAVASHHYAMIEGAGDAESVFTAPFNEKYHNIISPSLPVRDYMTAFDDWLKQLPASKRPTSAAYPTVYDPFAYPAVQTAQTFLQGIGIKTASRGPDVNSLCKIPANPNKTPACMITEESKYYAAAARRVAASKAQIVVLGSTDVPTVAEFMKVFEEEDYTPKIFIAVSGPDQGSAFLSAVGLADANGMMVPDGWYGGYSNALNNAMVEEYIARYGGTAASINSDVAEAYSVGQVAEDAIKETKGTDNTKILHWLHSGITLQTVQGPAKFDSLGRNPLAAAFIFQWKSGSFVPILESQVLAGGATKALVDTTPVFPKTAWQT